jgi:hypothetical protein
MKTSLISALVFSFFLVVELLPGNADAQKPKSEKIIIKSSDDEPMSFENLHDTIIISKDGKDTTIIKTMQDGKEKKVTVRKIITSGEDKDNLHWVEAEIGTMTEEENGDQVIVSKSKSGEPHTIRIEKRITKGDGSDSVIIKEIRHKELSDAGDITFDEPTGEKHTTVTVITSDGKDIETEGDGKTTIIYINDDKKCRRHKINKHGKQQKVYIIGEEKTIKKEE